MIVHNFSENCFKYENFEVWDVENMDAFFQGNSILATIFKTDYKISVEEFNERRHEIEETNMQIMEKLLDQVGDKHFFIFTLHNENHLDLVKMQKLNVMNFGTDIEAIQPDHVYIMIMDKKLSEYSA